VWDVFLLDPDFRIERPKRYYRQNIGNLLHSEKSDVEQQKNAKAGEPHRPHHHIHHHHEQATMPQIHPSPPDTERRSIISSIKTRVSKILHIDPNHPPPPPNGHADHGHQSDDADISDSASSNGSSMPFRVPTPMFDPSTHVNPLQPRVDGQGHEDGRVEGEQAPKPKEGTKQPVSSDVSKHTFYIVNSQMRLKLSARNEVCYPRPFFTLC
jgi:phospholipase D1/2